MKIKPANHSEAPLLAALIRDSFRDVAERFGLTPQNSPTHPSNCTADWITTALDKGIRYYLLEIDGRAGGCVALERANPDVCYLERLAVLPKYRRRGLGQALVEHAFHEAGSMDAKRVEIAIIAGHTELKKWYERLGFIAAETRRFDHLPFEVLFMFTEHLQGSEPTAD